jgi:hypothetical protein
MKIESEKENKIPALNNNYKFNDTRASSVDFEACLKELDAEPIQQSKSVSNTEQTLKQVQGDSLVQSDNNKKENLEKLSEKEKISVKLSKIDDINLFGRKKELLKHDKEFKFNLDHLRKEDINFLKTCLENPSITLNNLNPQNLQADFAVQNQGGQVSYKSFDVSKGLFNLMEYSFKTQKPVRLDFNGNSSVILKMNKDQKLVAEFISNDKAMEYVLKSSIPNLKNKLDSEGITYEEISYKDNSKNNNKRKNKGDNQ